MRKANGDVLFCWPLENHIITAGWTYNDGSSHHAIDLRSAPCTSVYAAEDGVVNQVQSWDGRTKSGMQSYGNMVRIRHNNYNGSKLETRYAHLKECLVKNGQHVYEGQLIGYSGATGNCYGAHLHFEVIYHDCRVNPLNWLDSNFCCATQTVMKHLGSYTSVPRESTKGDFIKIHATGVDMQAIIALCENLKLTYERSNK